MGMKGNFLGGDMNITFKMLEDNSIIEMIARDTLKRLGIKDNYDEYLSVAKLGIAKAKENYDKTKNTQLSTHIYNMARYSVLDYRKKMLKNSYRFKEIVDSDIIEDKSSNEMAIINRLDRNFNSRVMNKAFNLLKNDEIDIIKKRFWLNQSFPEIASSHNKSKQAIQQNLKKVLKKIENFLVKENFIDFMVTFSLEDKMNKLTNKEKEARVKELKAIIEADDKNIDAYQELSHLYMELKDAEGYFSLRKKLISVFKDIADQFNNPTLFTLLAGSYAIVKEYDKSLKYDKKALKLDPTNIKYLKNVGLSEFLLGNFNNSSKVLKEVVEKDSKNIQGYDYLIKSLINLGERKEAILYYKKVVETFKDVADEINSVDLFTLLADACSVTDNYTESLKYDKKALEIEPTNINLLKNVGLSFFFIKDYINSSKFLKEVIAKNPEDKESLEFLNKANDLIS